LPAKNLRKQVKIELIWTKGGRRRGSSKEKRVTGGVMKIRSEGKDSHLRLSRAA